MLGSNKTSKVRKSLQARNITELRQGYQEKTKSFLSDFNGYLSKVTKAYIDIVVLVQTVRNSIPANERGH
jgi:uncharacterized lipoprotein YehR (DUF1307 family)